MVRRIISFILLFGVLMGACVTTEAQELKLYGKAAILMDAESGTVLYKKAEKTVMPNASTTKIMTCLYILEHCDLDDVAKVSKNAASQPRVRLGVREGESYKVRDLLYGLMLESYNDCAVVLAEHAEGSVEAFEKKVNEKAKKLGAVDTHFVTPNGLDGTDSEGAHGTTAYDLAKLMSYCIKNKDFLTITRQKSYSFRDVSGKRTFTCQNHNALLSSMEGAISGKTGYTSKAGYCYVGAVEQNQMKLIVVTLASGWPPHKTYKWADVRTLVNYGVENYEKREVQADTSKITRLPVSNGIEGSVALKVKDKKIKFLLKKGDQVKIKCSLPERVKAPVKKGEKVGEIRFMVNGVCMASLPVRAQNRVVEKDFWWYLGGTIKEFCFF